MGNFAQLLGGIAGYLTSPPASSWHALGRYAAAAGLVFGLLYVLASLGVSWAVPVALLVFAGVLILGERVKG